VHGFDGRIDRRHSPAVLIVDHQECWPAQFADARGELEAVFTGTPCVIEHIGSTSVPGLRAKPVIDILLGTAALREHPPLAAEYARLKDDLARIHAGDKAAYSAAKAPFISQVLARMAGASRIRDCAVSAR
jgi:GrpB-like predicted nucleotidyltransferase (UPF0157 family)